MRIQILIMLMCTFHTYSFILPVIRKKLKNKPVCIEDEETCYANVVKSYNTSSSYNKNSNITSFQNEKYMFAYLEQRQDLKLHMAHRVK